MPSKSRADMKKAEADRLQAIVIDLLREEENKYCADCDAKQPRWASWNLGVFLCIRCAGIHRNLGVHLTKVKSVNLDSWTAEQVQSMRVMGNAKAKAVYEAELPDHFRRPQTDQALESFIRAKYEHKRYILKDWSPCRVDVNALPPPIDRHGRSGSASFKSSLGSTTAKTNSTPNALDSVEPTVPAPVLVSVKDTPLLDLSSPSSVAESTLCQVFSDSNPTKNSQGMSASLTNCENIDDLFGPIVSAPPAGSPPSLTTSCFEATNGTLASTSDAIDIAVQHGTSAHDLGDLATLSLEEPRPVEAKKTNSDILALFEQSSVCSSTRRCFMQEQQPPIIQSLNHDMNGVACIVGNSSLTPQNYHLVQTQFSLQQKPIKNFYPHNFTSLLSPSYGSNDHFLQQVDAVPVGENFLNRETAAVFAAASPFVNPSTHSSDVQNSASLLPSASHFTAATGKIEECGASFANFTQLDLTPHSSAHQPSAQFETLWN